MPVVTAQAWVEVNPSQRPPLRCAGGDIPEAQAAEEVEVSDDGVNRTGACPIGNRPRGTSIGGPDVFRVSGFAPVLAWAELDTLSGRESCSLGVLSGGC